MAEEATPPAGAAARVLHAVVMAWATIGGLVLIGIALLTTANAVLGTAFGVHISGEFEMAELGVAMVVFTFMPLAQLRRGYVIVDLFTQRAAPRTRAALDAAAGLVFALCMALITWRMFLGGIDIAETGERTAVLQIRYWWAFAVAVPSLALLVAACLHTMWSDLRRLKA
ncbi:MAG: TRAP transporter small permease [Betaproteobacteria bacterium]